MSNALPYLLSLTIHYLTAQVCAIAHFTGFQRMKKNTTEKRKGRKIRKPTAKYSSLLLLQEASTDCCTTAKKIGQGEIPGSLLW